MIRFNIIDLRSFWKCDPLTEITAIIADYMIIQDVEPLSNITQE